MGGVCTGAGWWGGVGRVGAGRSPEAQLCSPCVCSPRQTRPPLCFSLAKRLTFSQARRFLGLQRCRQYFNLGTGLSGATTEYFLSLNMPICELYGLSESTGVHTLSRQEGFRLLRWVWAGGGLGVGGGGGAEVGLVCVGAVGSRVTARGDDW